MDLGRHQNLSPEVWGGIECTVNRVGDVYYDQMERNGHARRISDLDHVADLGISAIRYPLLWERLAADGLTGIDWTWPDERLDRLQELGIKPIVGLVHHGSGPRHTSLTQPSFATGLAQFARAVAERYPWVECYTPVNEPLTTARFSGMYGVWYPHGHDELTFATAYLNQLRAIVLSMREIRQVNPGARLIQTEDLGKVHSTPILAYQADLENERRWLTFDLLSGNLDRDRPLWDYLLSIGIDEAELQWFVENPCPPDVLGINHYLTSERYLDERLELFPQHSHGGNGRDRYADVEAVRVATVELAGVEGLLRETWDRYGLPMAITELHLGCTREEQLRWFMDGWEAARSLRASGVDLRAVTAWSMFGSFDWNSLVTRTNNFYEPGVFDIRDGEPRPTAIAGLIKDLAAGLDPAHPAIPGTGWWRRHDRWFYPFGHPAVHSRSNGAPHEPADGPCIVVIGDPVASDPVVTRLCEMRGLPHLVVSPEELNVEEPEKTLDGIQPWALIIELARDGAPKGNGHSSGASLDDELEQIEALGRYCAERDTSLLVLSTSVDPVSSSGANGSDQLMASPTHPVRMEPNKIEEYVLDVLPDSLIVRSSARLPSDEDPELAVEALNASLDLLIDGERGVWNITSPV